LKKNLTVAVYSGVSVSTTFIERLIKGLAKAETSIYIFGADTGKPIQNKNVYYRVYGRKRHKLFMLLKYTVLLMLFKPKEKKALDAIIAGSDKKKHLLQLKYYPVLYYQPDIFHIQWAKSLEDWIWVQDFGMRLVLSLRGAHINYSPIVDEQLANSYKKGFPKVPGFHAVSKEIAKEATKYHAKLDTIKVIKSGLNLDKFPFELKAFDTKSTLNILSVGRDHWKKNYRLALDVMFRLKELGVNFHYSIIGVTQNEALIYQRSQLGLDKEVSFINTLPFKEVQAAIQQADVLLLPSVEEGIANVVLEAMALGTLVVSTNCGGMAEVVIPSQTGYLVPIRDVQAMTKILVELSQLPLETYQQTTQHARTFVEKHHNEDQMVGEMQALYNKLVSKE
jgi:glycosyltransferase involved in cell wall biosynthesis